MVRILARRSRAQNTHGETKRAWYAAETYQIGTILKVFTVRPSDRDILAVIGSVTWYLRISEQATRLLIG